MNARNTRTEDTAAENVENVENENVESAPAESDAPVFEFVDVPENTQSNEYDPIVTALIAAGPGKGFPITVPTVDVQKHIRRFSDAAKRQDKTARKVSQKVDGINTTVIVKLVPKITRKGTDEGAAEGGEVAAAE
jgi:hypothetical protein